MRFTNIVALCERTSHNVNVIQAVDRALRLLELIAETPDGLTGAELSAAAGVNRSTAWRLLATLEAHDLVSAIPTRAATASASARCASRPSRPARRIARRARPILERLVARGGRGRHAHHRRRLVAGGDRPGRRAAGRERELDRSHDPGREQLGRQARAGLVDRRGDRRLPGRPPHRRAARRYRGGAGDGHRHDLLGVRAGPERHLGRGARPRRPPRRVRERDRPRLPAVGGPHRRGGAAARGAARELEHALAPPA